MTQTVTGRASATLKPLAASRAGREAKTQQREDHATGKREPAQAGAREVLAGTAAGCGRGDVIDSHSSWDTWVSPRRQASLDTSWVSDPAYLLETHRPRRSRASPAAPCGSVQASLQASSPPSPPPRPEQSKFISSRRTASRDWKFPSFASSRTATGARGVWTSCFQFPCEARSRENAEAPHIPEKSNPQGPGLVEPAVSGADGKRQELRPPPQASALR